jgi:hypothetical protein
MHPANGGVAASADEQTPTVRQECQTLWVTSNSSANGLDFDTNLCSNENVFE